MLKVVVFVLGFHSGNRLVGVVEPEAYNKNDLDRDSGGHND